MSRWRARLRRLRRWLVYGVAGLVIIAGLAVAVLGQLLPVLGAHPERVAAWLSERAGRPVSIEALRAAWTRRGPRFDLDGLRIGRGDDSLGIGHAELQIDVYAGLLPGRPLTALQLSGSQLELIRDATGPWRLQGIGDGGGGGSATDALRRLDVLGELRLIGARLHVVDARLGIDFTVPRIDARLQRRGGELLIGLLADVGGRPPLRFNLAFDPSTLRGRGYVGGSDLRLADWRGLLPFDTTRIAAAALQAGLWFRFDTDGPLAADLALTLDRMRLAEPAPPSAELGPAAAAGPQFKPLGTSAPAAADPLPQLGVTGHWQRSDGGGWQARLVGGDGIAGGFAELTRAGDGQLTIRAGDWPLDVVARFAAAAADLPPALSGWLDAAHPGGRLRGLLATLDAERRPQRLQARVDDLHFAPVGRAPGLDGLDVAVDGDADALAVELAGAPLTVDWPPALLRPLAPATRGRLQLFRDGDVPVLGIERLTLHEPDYDITVAGDIRFDGGKPSLDLRAEVGPGPVTAAKLFWIRHKMPPGTVRWLDEAITDGRIAGGRALFHGDLDDWPFRRHQGRFEAEANIEDVTLKFRPDWPAAEHLSGSARFIDNGMLIETGGSLRRVEAPHARGTIADFHRPLLELDIDAAGSGPAMLDLLRHSPLEIAYGEHFDALTIGGRGTASVQLAIPLGHRTPGEAHVQGTVQLHDAELADARWNLAFERADGAVRFSERGLTADALQVQYGGAPARFGLAIGSFTEHPANIAEARLEGRLDADTLLAAAPSIDWLRPYWNGRSNWWLALAVPRPERGLAPTLRAHSDLVGTRIALPAPLAKSEAVQLPLDLQFDLPQAGAASGDGRLELRLGELLRLYGRLGDGGHLDGVAAFGAAPSVERPAQGLRVVGQVPVLDLGGWAGLAMASSDGGDGVLADLDLEAGEIDLLDRALAESRLQFRRAADGAAEIAFAGSSIDGRIELPPEPLRATRGITARFERLHWPEATHDAPALAMAEPAALPPLHVWIGDLKLGESALGAARLETFPTEHGMRIDRFDTKSDDLELFARGDWTRQGLQQQSDFSIEFTAPDLGAMLRALGFEALIDGGQTLARLQARWPGAPSAFALDGVDGWLEVSVGKGRIPKVDPGGVGRVFGLLSLSEIPRRLALDFSDFFQAGLAFNKIEGRFTLNDGNAVTDNLTIDGPAAEIHIRGRTGLGSRDYDQTMEVLPRAGNVLPVVGALAGGPAGAAIGAVAQAVLSKPFKQMTRTLYKVAGSWDAPTIEVLERGPAKPGERNATAEADSDDRGSGPP